MADPGAGLSLSALGAADVEAILAWRYPGEYSVYDLAPGDEPKLSGAGSDCLAVRRRQRLVGFVCLGHEARVPGMERCASVVDLGLGLCPELTGLGASRDLIPAILSELERRLGRVCFRAAIAAWNLRAQRAAEHAGFEPTAEHRNERGTYVILVRRPAEVR